MSLSSMWCQDGELALFTRFIVGIPAGTLPGTADPPGNIVVHPPETSIFKIKRKKKESSSITCYKNIQEL